MASSKFGHKLYPYQCLREPLGVKGVRQSVMITNNPSTIDQNQQLLVRFPNLGAHAVLQPRRLVDLLVDLSRGVLVHELAYTAEEGGLAQDVWVDPCRLRVPGAEDEAVIKGTGWLAGDNGLCILVGHPGDVAEVGHLESGPSANSQVLVAVDGLVGDGRKASTVHPQSPGAEVSRRESPSQRKSLLNPRPAAGGKPGHSARRSWTISSLASGMLRMRSTSFANPRGSKACGGTTRWAHTRASITAPLHSVQRGARMFRRSQERMMRPTKELPSDTLLNWMRRRPRSMTVGIWPSRTSQRLPRFLLPNRGAAGPSTCSSLRIRMPRSLVREWSHSTREAWGWRLRRAHGARPPWWWRCTGLPACSSSSDYVGACRLSRWASYSARQLPHDGGLSGCWNTMADSKLSALYYSPRGYWKGLAAIEKLVSAAKVTEQQAKDWLKRQAIWQIYLPAPRHVPRPKFDVAVPNEVLQADLLFLPHDCVGRKTFRYALTVVDVASRYKEAEPLTSKTAAEVADALSRIYRRGPLKWPKLLQVDPGREFMGAVSQLLAKHSVQVRRSQVDIHRDQGIIERWNRTLPERLLGHQYTKEMCLPSGQRSTEWVAQLPSVVAALNGEVTRLTGKKPSDAIKAKTMAQKPSSVVPDRPVGLKEQRLPSGVGVRYLYEPGDWRAVGPARLTLYGLLRCAGWDARWPSPTSQCCITCRTARRVVLSGRNSS